VPWPLGVYRGPPEVYRGPCMKITRLNQTIIFTYTCKQYTIIHKLEISYEFTNDQLSVSHMFQTV